MNAECIKVIMQNAQGYRTTRVPLYTTTYLNVSMNTQVNVKLSEKMAKSARKYADSHGFDTIQDLIRELLREKLFECEEKQPSGLATYKASESALAKRWLTKEEDDAWKHLQEGR